MMNAQTTIMIRRQNKNKLDHLKAELGADSYDEVISHLFAKSEGPEEVLFGCLAGLPPFNERKDGLHERINRYSLLRGIPPGDTPRSSRKKVHRRTE